MESELSIVSSGFLDTGSLWQAMRLKQIAALEMRLTQ